LIAANRAKHPEAARDPWNLPDTPRRPLPTQNCVQIPPILDLFFLKSWLNVYGKAIVSQRAELICLPTSEPAKTL
jgi:hypothetical protein